MDQDGCGKKLICELRAKQKSGFTVIKISFFKKKNYEKLDDL